MSEIEQWLIANGCDPQIAVYLAHSIKQLETMPRSKHDVYRDCVRIWEQNATILNENKNINGNNWIYQRHLIDAINHFRNISFDHPVKYHQKRW